MSEFIKVKERPDLVREKNSKAILNTDVSALNKYKEEREFKLKLVKIVNEHESLKRDVMDIKSMLSTILERVQ